MHELAITQSILEIATRHASEARAVRVKTVHLVIGRLSSYVDDSVQFCWDLVSKGTICEGARLEFRRTPARLLCLECNTDYTFQQDLTPCPACGSDRVRVTGGDEFRLDAIDIETDGTEETEEQ